jgi:23S rRNA (uridine2552-2'-O)-methyltransferase
MAGGGSKGSRDPRSRSRGKHVRVKTARGRKLSSTRWLERQLNDPFVAEARRLGYRSRSAFKLMGIDDKFAILKRARRIVDLGAAPGGWAQVMVERVSKGTKLLGIDLQEMEPLTGAEFLKMDFLALDAEERLMAALDGPADLVLSDMANAATGHKQTDHLRTMALCEAALEFALKVLAPGGAFVAKVLVGGTEGQLLAAMKKNFATVRHFKPDASRQESSELYVVATGFRGVTDEPDGDGKA